MAAKNKAPKYRGVANPELAAAMRGFRSSGAAGTHANTPNRQRTRATAKKVAISQGW